MEGGERAFAEQARHRAENCEVEQLAGEAISGIQGDGESASECRTKKRERECVCERERERERDSE